MINNSGHIHNSILYSLNYLVLVTPRLGYQKIIRYMLTNGYKHNSTSPLRQNFIFHAPPSDSRLSYLRDITRCVNRTPMVYARVSYPLLADGVDRQATCMLDFSLTVQEFLVFLVSITLLLIVAHCSRCHSKLNNVYIIEDFYVLQVQLLWWSSLRHSLWSARLYVRECHVPVSVWDSRGTMSRSGCVNLLYLHCLLRFIVGLILLCNDSPGVRSCKAFCKGISWADM